MNNRWLRNQSNINAIVNKINILKEKNNDGELDQEIEDLELEINNLKLDFKDLVNNAKDDLKTLYLDENDDRDWAVAWSGGKDSTCVMGLVVDMLEELEPDQRKRKIHAVMSDTMIENPNLEIYMLDQVEKLKDYVKKTDLPITVNLVQRELKHSYFYLILGRGYFLPQNNGRGRWCTGRLKLNPQNELLKDIDPSFILLGVRLSESAKRKASIEKWTDNDNLDKKIGNHANLTQSKTFMPIVDFTIEDVWEYLQKERLQWSTTHDVRRLYRDATGECGFSNPKGTEVKASQSETCGARFGCWTCPVILKDRSTEEMSKNNEWMKPLSDFRTMQLKVMGDFIPNKPINQNRKARSYVLTEAKRIGKEIKKITKSGHKRNGKRYIDNHGVIHNDKGTFTVEGRKFLFNELIKTQEEVNKLRLNSGLKEIELISEDEISMIKDMWKLDEKHSEWLITNVNDIPISKLTEYINELNDLENNQPLKL